MMNRVEWFSFCVDLVGGLGGVVEVCSEKFDQCVDVCWMCMVWWCYDVQCDWRDVLVVENCFQLV